MAHNPGMLIAVPLVSLIVPTSFPVVVLKALILPSLTFPTSNVLLSGPKFDGANARPHGPFRTEVGGMDFKRVPVGENTSTAPVLAPSKVTITRFLMKDTPYTVIPVSFVSVNVFRNVKVLS